MKAKKKRYLSLARRWVNKKGVYGNKWRREVDAQKSMDTPEVTRLSTLYFAMFRNAVRIYGKAEG